MFGRINRYESLAFSETVSKSQNFKITHTTSRFSFLVRAVSVVECLNDFNRVTLQHSNEFIIIFFCYLMVSVITMCYLIKRLIRATFLKGLVHDNAHV